MKRTLKSLTRKDFTEILREELKNFATKDDLNSLEKRMGDRFATKDDVITFKDAILKEIKDMRDEVAIVGGQRDMLEDHDQKIGTIEKHLHIHPSP